MGFVPAFMPAKRHRISLGTSILPSHGLLTWFGDPRSKHRRLKYLVLQWHHTNERWLVDGRVSHCINQILFLLCGLKEIHQSYRHVFFVSSAFSKGMVCALHRDNGMIRLRVTGYLMIDSNHILGLKWGVRERYGHYRYYGISFAFSLYKSHSGRIGD